MYHSCCEVLLMVKLDELNVHVTPLVSVHSYAAVLVIARQSKQRIAKVFFITMYCFIIL